MIYCDLALHIVPYMNFRRCNINNKWKPKASPGAVYFKEKLNVLHNKEQRE